MPMLDEGLALAPVVSAMMDCSDGVCLDVRRMALASGVTIEIAASHLPIPKRVIDGWWQTIPDLRDHQERSLRLAAANWGDDYALLFTAADDADLPVSARRIGTVQERGAHPLLIDGAPPPDPLSLGYTHG